MASSQAQDRGLAQGFLVPKDTLIKLAGGYMLEKRGLPRYRSCTARNRPVVAF
jgi:hypothetical protein